MSISVATDSFSGPNSNAHINFSVKLNMLRLNP